MLLAVRVHLWDLSGHDEYADVRNELYSNADVIFMVYDVTQKSSFDNLEAWLKEQKKYGTGSPILALVGSKVRIYGINTYVHVLTVFTCTMTVS